MKCRHCQSLCVKAGRSRNGTQRYRCNSCERYQQAGYLYRAHDGHINQSIIRLLTEGVGIRGIARILKISGTTTVLRIKAIARMLCKPKCCDNYRVYEIDELWTYVGSKANNVWITYALDRVSKQVVDFVVGSRTKEHLAFVTSTTLALKPLKVCTDGLSVYRSLIPVHLHRVGLPHTRRIERFNLNLRTHLKRLARKTIAFSKSLDMLESCLKIYFWQRNVWQTTIL